MFDHLLIGVSNLFHPLNLVMITGGLIAGVIFGSLPGFTATMGVAVLVPVTYWVPPQIGLNLLSAIFCGAVYGGSISAVLLRIPGTPASVPTTFDGYVLTQQGQAARALGMVTFASAIGGVLSALALLLGAPILSMWALKFGPPEVLALAIMGLSVVSSLSPGNILKGVIACLFGLILAVVGQDPIDGFPRLTFGAYQLLGGIPLVPLLIGIFSIPPAMEMAEKGIKKTIVPHVTGTLFPSLSDIRKTAVTILRSSLIGIGIGIIPAAGPDIASFIAYNDAARSAKEPKKFGSGDIRGVAASEAANNGCTGGSLIPLFTLGIPGSAPAAVFLGAMFIHGLRPGPMIFDTRPEIGYTVLVSFIFINVLMYFVGVGFCRLCYRVVEVPEVILAPVIVALTVIGSFAIGRTMYDVWVMFASGIIGYVMTKFDFPLSPIALALILGPMIEGEAERMLLMFHGNLFLFFTRPLAAALFLASMLMVCWPLIRRMWRKRPAGSY
jgi:putative tricarboxylic transport membrane protein